MGSSTIGPAYLVGLFGVVASGAVLPMVPTGAAVSVAAALAGRDDPLLLVLVAAGAAGAYTADLATYAVLRLAGHRAMTGSGPLTRWLHRARQGHAIDRVQRQLAEHELRTLLLSRLIPGGQLPVLLAAALGGYPWRRYAVADVAAASLWSAMYAATGLAGRAVFPRRWEGAAAGIALVLSISAVASLIARSRRRKASARADREAEV